MRRLGSLAPLALLCILALVPLFAMNLGAFINVVAVAAIVVVLLRESGLFTAHGVRCRSCHRIMSSFDHRCRCGMEPRADRIARWLAPLCTWAALVTAVAVFVVLILVAEIARQQKLEDELIQERMDRHSQQEILVRALAHHKAP